MTMPIAVWVASLVGVSVVAFAAGVLYRRPRPRHTHSWGPWHEWGITYQRRRCQTCGRMKIKGQ